jgi:hypothetical protein
MAVQHAELRHHVARAKFFFRVAGKEQEHALAQAQWMVSHVFVSTHLAHFHSSPARFLPL